ncbi:hypothetical protein KUTeg_000258, partial [Tegillarca granosa]
MQAKELLERLRQYDAYPKTLEDFRVKTYGGAAGKIDISIDSMTLVSSVIMFILFVSELNYYLSKDIQPELFVDTIDAMDVSGEQQLDVDHHLFKQRLKKDGTKVEENPEKQGKEAYRKRGWAFNNPETIEQCMREGWTEKMKAQKEEGCQLYGYLEVNKVAGNFHFAPGKSFQQHHVHVHDLQAFGGQKYFVKIVPTTYVKANGSILFTNQYSVTKHSKVVGSITGESGLPGVFFMYELSPMMVKYTEKN